MKRSLILLPAVLTAGCFSFSVDPEIRDCFNEDCPVGQRCVEGLCAPVVAPEDAGPADMTLNPVDACLEGCGVAQAPICDTEPPQAVLDGLIELCGNEIDDDCDGAVDEADSRVYYRPDPGGEIRLGIGEACTVGQGICAADGVVLCDPDGEGARLSCSVSAGDPQADEACNGLDDDCDGRTDEGIEGVGVACSSGLGACANLGTTICGPEGEPVCDASPGDASAEVCDSVDNDCDGSTDEDFLIGTACTAGLGICQRSGAYSCNEAGDSADCLTPTLGDPEDERCDGELDEDCDGNVDEGFVEQLGVACEVGVGACLRSGLTLCVDGGVGCGVEPGIPSPLDQTCDGVDDDCDGELDEGYADIAQPLTCGVGACQANGSTACVEGAVVDQCTPGDPEDADASCNNQDNDCDGRVDEDFVVANITCGLGVCQATGLRSCVSGEIQSSCTPADGEAVDFDGVDANGQDQCDGLDNDCDGEVDEDFVGAPVACGQGGCRVQSRTICVAGDVVNPCTPEAPAANDATCDGVDDDCDGAIDEDSAQTQLTCGLGVCRNEGVQFCLNGEETRRCTPLDAPADIDADCNGLDDDCDGLVDEDFPVDPIQCDDGLCNQQGIVQCINGEVRSSCRDGVAIPEDGNCNGVDEDCDGVIDEEYDGGDALCQVEGATGLCAIGSPVCLNGGVQCRPQPPRDEICNGIDDDCDGVVDNIAGDVCPAQP